MKALTICQPYAELIARGIKRVENRTWSTPYRGPLLIHAGKNRNWLDLDESETRDEQYDIPLSEMQFGFLVARCELVTCVPILAVRSLRYAASFPWLNDHDHTEGPFCWVLENIERLPQPIQCRGAQGIFEVPAEVEAVMSQPTQRETNDERRMDQ